MAIIKSAETKRILIEPNTEVKIRGYLDKQLPYHPVCCLIQSTKGSLFQEDIDITPTIVSYTYGQTKEAEFYFSNISTRTITISPNAILCELHPVTIENLTRFEKEEKMDTETSKLITEEGVTICTDDLTPEEIQQGKN